MICKVCGDGKIMLGQDYCQKCLDRAMGVQMGKRIIETSCGFEPIKVAPLTTVSAIATPPGWPFQPIVCFLPWASEFLIHEVRIGSKVQPMGGNLPGDWFLGDPGIGQGRRVAWDTCEIGNTIIITFSSLLEAGTRTFFGLVHGKLLEQRW